MKRSPKEKRFTPRVGSTKKQKSILSFFQTSSRTPNPPAAKPLSGTRPLTPSTTASLDHLPSPKRSPAVSNSAHPADVPSHELRRELFAEDDDDIPIKRASKRRRLVRLDDFSDDDEERGNPASPSQSIVGQAVPATPPALAMAQLPQTVPLATGVQSQYDAAGDSCKDDPPYEAARDPDKPGMLEEPTREGRYDFSSLQYHRQDGAIASTIASPPSKARKLARKKLGALDDNRRASEEEEGGWCMRHPWAVDIRDAKKRLPSHPDYDKTTLFVPPGLLVERSRSTKEGGLSPFQKQFWSIKSANYDVLIFFKKGKFYEMYDVDADVGHKVLGLNFTKGGRVDMRCCGVPEQSFEKHTARLIDLGYKVGRVEQTETANAAERRKNGAGSNKSSVCQRALVRILTKATATDDGLLRDHRSRYVLAVVESQKEAKSSDPDRSATTEGGNLSMVEDLPTTLGVCYVDVASGSINIGEFDDDVRLAKMNRLMTFLRPQEIIVDCSAVSLTLSGLVKWASNTNEAEVIDAGRKSGFADISASRLEKYILSGSSSNGRIAELDRVRAHLERFPLSSEAFGAMSSHLESLIIDQETLSLGHYNLFPEMFPSPSSGSHLEKDLSGPLFQTSSCLRMDAPTLQNLEVLASNIDGSERGSLLSFVDRAHTPAGRRLIRKWIAEPLVSSDAINDRLRAVEDIHKLQDLDGGRTLVAILKQLKTRKDLERALPKLHQQAIVADTAVMFDDSNKRKVKAFVDVIRSLEESLQALESFCEAISGCGPRSERLMWTCSVGCGVPANASKKLKYFLGEAFDMVAAEKQGEILPKEGAVASYDKCRAVLNFVESELSQELEKWRTYLGDTSVKYYHRGKEPYQMEIDIDTLGGRTPNEFEVVSESKTAKRFYTPQIRRLVQRQVEASESFEEASSMVARDMMRQFDEEYNTWSAIGKACAELDALIGLAFASRDEGSGVMSKPEILANSHSQPCFAAKGLRHPILAAKSAAFVANDVALGTGAEPEIMILTGPNAGGKSTLARQVAVSVILAQLGCFVPAEALSLRPFEDIFVRMGASDDLARGRSTFMVEMEEVGHILNNANSKSLIVADEVGRGTSTHDGYAVAFAALDHIAKVNRSLTVFSTHYSHLGSDIVSTNHVDGQLSAGLFEMGAVIDKVCKKITFLYKLQRGRGGDSRGIYCARIAGIPESIAADAEKASRLFDETLSHRHAAIEFRRTCEYLRGNDEVAFRALMQSCVRKQAF